MASNLVAMGETVRANHALLIFAAFWFLEGLGPKSSLLCD